MEQGALVGGRFRAGTLVGRGGMAEVHLGLDTESGDAVAIKRLRPDQVCDATAHDLFAVEARTASLLSHPGVVRVVATGADLQPGIDGPVPYLVMELVRGRSLRAILMRRRLGIPRALQITRDLLDALGHVHACGLVHRDVKPGNVMVGDDGVKLMDFGIARPAGAPAGAAGYGTAKYLSPEQAHEGAADPRSDLYAMACVLYEMLTGQPPFVAGSASDVVTHHLLSAPVPPSVLNPDVSPELDAVVLQGLGKSPDERFATADAMRIALAEVPDGRPASVPAVTEPVETDSELVWDAPVPPRPLRPTRGLLAAPLAAVFFLVATCGLGNVFGLTRAPEEVAVAALVVAPEFGRVTRQAPEATAPAATAPEGRPAPESTRPPLDPRASHKALSGVATPASEPVHITPRTARSASHTARPRVQSRSAAATPARKPVAKPVTTKPVTTKPVATRPTPTKPAPTKPSPTKPAPTPTKPTKPAQPKPTQPKPTQPKPTQPKPTQPKDDKAKERAERIKRQLEQARQRLEELRKRLEEKAKERAAERAEEARERAEKLAKKLAEQAKERAKEKAEDAAKARAKALAKALAEALDRDDD